MNGFEKYFQPTFKANFPNTRLIEGDINIPSDAFPNNMTGIIGGPPCQAWSEGGKQLGFKDPRGQLFLEYIRIANMKKPKFFVIENIQGILEDKHKLSLDFIIRSLQSIGYSIKYQLLNAADYRIPQDRFRVFFVGIRNDLQNTFTFPTAVTDKKITLKEAIGDIIESPRFFNEETITEEHPTRKNHDVYTGSYDAKYMARNRVRSWNEQSFTIQAQARNEPQHPQAPKMTYISSDKRIFAKGYELLYRRFSVRECARIQTFPDSFVFIYTDIKNGYKMVGNAVPPRLAYAIAIQIRNALPQ